MVSASFMGAKELTRLYLEGRVLTYAYVPHLTSAVQNLQIPLPHFLYISYLEGRVLTYAYVPHLTNAVQNLQIPLPRSLYIYTSAD